MILIAAVHFLPQMPGNTEAIRSRKDHWRRLSDPTSGRAAGEFCAIWFPGQEFTDSLSSRHLAFNFRRDGHLLGSVVIFIGDSEDHPENVYRNLSLQKIKGRIDRALTLERRLGTDLEIPGLERMDRSIIFKELQAAKGAIVSSGLFNDRTRGLTLRQLYRSEEIPAEIYQLPCMAILAKRIIECN